MDNGFCNVNADTRKNIHPFKKHNFTFKGSFGGSTTLGILPRYSYPYITNDIAAEDDVADSRDVIGDILSNIPSIKIREYTQDLKITTVLNLVDYAVQGFSDAGEVIKGMKASTAFAQVIQDEFRKSETWEYIFGSGLVVGSMNGIPDATDKKMLALTYNLYYHIMGHTSTNTYELPFISKYLYETNGMDGWPTGPESGWGGTSSNSIVGKVLNFVGSNFKIITEPIWKPISSSGTSIELTIHLFNDTLENAALNYVFVQTITSHNMPLQYGIIQQPPSCYEINITGGKRLFMCSGKFSVSNIGVNRSVSENLVKEIKLYARDASLISPDIIRIPDVYEVKLTFKSLLPDVFNDFMYQFTMQNLSTMRLGKENSVLTDMGDKLEAKVSEILGKAKAAAAREEAACNARKAAMAEACSKGCTEAQQEEAGDDAVEDLEDPQVLEAQKRGEKKYQASLERQAEAEANASLEAQRQDAKYDVVFRR